MLFTLSAHGEAVRALKRNLLRGLKRQAEGRLLLEKPRGETASRRERSTALSTAKRSSKRTEKWHVYSNMETVGGLRKRQINGSQTKVSLRNVRRENLLQVSVEMPAPSENPSSTT